MTRQEAAEQQLDEIIAQAERERTAVFDKAISEINAQIDKVRNQQVELLAKINYLKGRIDEAKSICGEKETENAEA